MTSIGSLLNTNTASLPATPLIPNPPLAGSSSGLSFGDVLDAVNPLQHIPGVSNMYRAITGNQISPVSQIAGDTLYGAAMGGVSALIGFAASAADVAVKEVTGENISQHLVSAVNSVTSAISGNATTKTTAPTPLIPNNAAASLPVPHVTGNTITLSAQMNNAVNGIYHPSAHYHNPSAQYQRAQAFDIINKNLVQMAV